MEGVKLEGTVPSLKINPTDSLSLFTLLKGYSQPVNARRKTNVLIQRPLSLQTAVPFQGAGFSPLGIASNPYKKLHLGSNLQGGALRPLSLQSQGGFR